MKTFFQDEFMNSKVLSRMVREVKKSQLNQTIDALGSLNEAQSQVISRCDFSPVYDDDLEFIKKVNNARRKNI
ncbi:MAG: hypothetical protein IJW73_04135 [Candidatus Gastranaerophilales bacterium]|nr:hypothetical protein [Candidatus Gastranaerophilales bacterium]